MTYRKTSLSLAALFAALLVPAIAGAQSMEMWYLDLEGASGSTVGPDGALYVTERLAGRVTRVDPWTGSTEPYAEGLPIPAVDIGVGGATDVVFIDETAYVLVNVVGPAFDVLAADFGQAPGFAGDDAVGIYRVDSPTESTLIADIGAWSVAHPPETSYFLDHGVQYALEAFRGGLLVTDGHHNRLLRVSLGGNISEFNVFENIVPTGLEVHGKTVLMGEAGPAPHLPENGKVVAIDAKTLATSEIAAGAPLVVDVEFGLGQRLYVLAQGVWCAPEEIDPECDDKMDGAPAEPGGGSLHEVNGDGSLTEVASGLNLPTSVEFIGNDAFVISLAGDIWVIRDVSRPPFGRRR
jgi:hypothetical protein